MNKIKPIDDCETVTELFADPRRWAQGGNAFDCKGNSVYPESKKATCFCLSGGIQRVYKSFRIAQGIRTKIAAEVNSVMTFNDSNDYETVYGLIKELGV